MRRIAILTAVWFVFQASAPAKITLGTVTPIAAGLTTLIVNGATIIDSIKHPKKAAKKVKAAIKGTK